MDALGQAALDAVPFLGGDDARQQIGGNDPLGRLVVVVDGEGDALVQEALLAGLLAAVEFFQRQGGKARVHRGIGRARLAVGREHLVIGLAQLVIGVGRVHAGAGRPARAPGDIGAAKVFRVGESLMLHTRSLHGRCKRCFHFAADKTPEAARVCQPARTQPVTAVPKKALSPVLVTSASMAAWLGLGRHPDRRKTSGARACAVGRADADSDHAGFVGRVSFWHSREKHARAARREEQRRVQRFLCQGEWLHGLGKRLPARSHKVLLGAPKKPRGCSRRPAPGRPPARHAAAHLPAPPSLSLLPQRPASPSAFRTSVKPPLWRPLRSAVLRRIWIPSRRAAAPQGAHAIGAGGQDGLHLPVTTAGPSWNRGVSNGATSA